MGILNYLSKNNQKAAVKAASSKLIDPAKNIGVSGDGAAGGLAGVVSPGKDIGLRTISGTGTGGLLQREALADPPLPPEPTEPAEGDTSWYQPTPYTPGTNSTADAYNGITIDPKTGNAISSAGNNLTATGMQVNDWSKDKSDYLSQALKSGSGDEFSTWMTRLKMQREAQGGTLSDAEYRQYYDQWTGGAGNYQSKFRGDDGSDGVGYYGQDENGKWGYFADAAHTQKLENGWWNKTGKINNLSVKNGMILSAGDNGGGSYADTLSQLTGGSQIPTGQGQTGGYSDILAELLRKLYEGQDSAYAQAIAEQKAAQQAAVQRAINQLEAQKTATNQGYGDYARQAYVDRMNAAKNLDQRLAAQGITGGASESAMLALDTAYSDALRQSEQGRINAVTDLDRAIADAQLNGDIAGAQAAAALAKEQTDNYASVLQALINRYDTIAARQQAYDREDAQRAEDLARTDAQMQQAYNREDAATQRQYAYNLAMQLLGNGNMPDAATLTAAGINANDAALLISMYNDQLAAAQAAQAAEQAAAAAKPKLTAAQVNAAIKAGTLTPEVLSAYEYWYGAPYVQQTGSVSNSGPTQSTSPTQNTQNTRTSADTTVQSNASYSDVKRTILGLISQGNIERAQTILNTYWNSFNSNQQNELRRLFG